MKKEAIIIKSISIGIPVLVIGYYILTVLLNQYIK